MTLKRLVLSLLTALVIFVVGSSLWQSLDKTQVTNLLELYQTDLLLQATEVPNEENTESELAQIRKAVLGETPLKTALEQYQEVRKTAATDLEKLTETPKQAAAAPEQAVAEQQREKLVEQQRSLLQQLDLRIGVLQAQSGQEERAIATWNTLNESPYNATAATLAGLWSEPPRLLPDADVVLERNLKGWFRYASLSRLYELQQRTEALASLRETEGAIAQNTLFKLLLVGSLPAIAGMMGAGLLIFLIVQRAVASKQAILAVGNAASWETPWDGETVWQVFIVGFFFIGQIVLPNVLAILRYLGLNFNAFGTRAGAISALTFYVLMAISTLTILFLSIRRYRPLPEGWFRFQLNFKGALWGVGGYLVALPIMIVVSLVNQQIWQGTGGSNPLLKIVLEEGDPIALAIFLFTAAIAAPIFEELLFRGFLLPSLTKYFPVWGAIALSSLLFAIAHLSFSEVIPLTALGAVLATVYVRSRNLFAPMLLHALWNSITMIGLFILGSSAQ